MDKLYGIIGVELGHSFSPVYFKQKFEQEGITKCEYKFFPLAGISLIPEFLEKYSNLHGFNVTIPYKKSIMFFLDEIDPVADAVGAVNVVKINRSGKRQETIGYNTDVYGFKASLLPLLKPWHTEALILGTGGAAQAVAFVLKELKISFQFVSRNKVIGSCLSYNDLSEGMIKTNTLIINTTPVGMFPYNNEMLPFPFRYLTTNHLLYDLIYNPEKTKFLQEGEKYEAEIKNGLEMLHLQAERAWHIWNND